MTLTITGSLGNISRPLIEKLVASGHDVRVISSNPEKASEIKALKATPLIGSLTDTAFILQSLKGADGLYAMVPPDFSVSNYNDFADKIHQNYVQAIHLNDIQFVVNLSSIGVPFAGVNPLENFYNLEKRLDNIPGLNLVHLRPAMFYTNFYGSLPLVKHQGIIGHNVAGSTDLLMTHPVDIAETAFSFLNTLSFSGSQVKYVISDVKSGNEIAKIISEAIAKPLTWVQFTDDDLRAALLQNGFTRDAADSLVIATGKAIREGLFDVFKKEVLRGRKFVDFAQEFKRVYQLAG